MKRRSSSGFTMIEVLVALLIFSLGLMGMAALMVLSVKTNQSAYLRTQASFLAQAMADRVRVNIAQVNAYNGTYGSATVGADPCASGAACSPANMVVLDRVLWSQQLVDSLPNPTAVIACGGNVLGGAMHTALRRGSQSATPADATPEIQTFAWVFQP